MLWSASLGAAEPIRFDQPLRVAWQVEEVLDGERLNLSQAPDAWREALAKLNLNFVDAETTRSLSTLCDPDDMAEGDWCPELTSQHADVLISGQISAESRVLGPGGPKAGVKSQIQLTVWVVDDGHKLTEIKLPPYGTGEDNPAAYRKSLAVVAAPFGITLSHGLNSYLKLPFEGTLSVTGFSSDSEREDPLTSLRYLPGVTSLILTSKTVDRVSYAIGYSGQTWGQVIARINSRQGSGINARITGSKQAEGRYDLARAFRLLTLVAETGAQSKLGLTTDECEQVSIALEKALGSITYAMIPERPTRLPNRANKAVADMKREFGGDLILSPRLVPERGSVTLIVEVWSTFAGRLFSVTTTLENDDIAAAANTVIADIAAKLPDWLARRHSNLPPLKRKQYSDWRQSAGL
jgi:hypothetical protein